MKSLWFIVGAVAIASFELVAAGTQPVIDLYSKRYNNLDIDTILNSERLVRNYVDCLLSRKPCSPEGKELKRLLPEALRTKCGKCSNNQKEAALRVIKNLYTRYPVHYNELREKWDASGEYHRKFEEYLSEEQFNNINGDQSQPEVYATSPIPILTQRPARNPEGERNPGASPIDPPSFSFDNRFAEDEIETGASALSTTHDTAYRPITGVTYLPPSTLAFGSTLSLNPTTIPSVTTRPASVVKTLETTSIRITQSTIVDDNSPIVGSDSNIDSVVSSKVSTITTASSRAPAIVPSTTSAPPRAPTFIEALFPPLPQSSQPFPANGPFAPFIQRLGAKISNTAEFFAEMVRNTVKFKPL